MSESNKKNWVFYDGTCNICVSMTKRFVKMLPEKDFSFAPLQLQWVKEKTGLTQVNEFNEMKILTDQGIVLGGIDAVAYISRRIWWLWPLYRLAQFIFLRRVLEWVYKMFARKRYCVAGRCELATIRDINKEVNHVT